jgi:O-acetyl-ADP-ribose deacetylase (regulator of RNase III)
MGKGIALQFKKLFPANYKAYKKACDNGDVNVGHVFVYDLGAFHTPQFVINFPTKKHWKGKSQIEDIESGLISLVEEIKRLGIKSIAVPPLGCGNGGLNWSEVAPLIDSALRPLEGVVIHLYEPSGVPEVDSVKISSQQPNMTEGRAIIIALLHRYMQPGFDPYASLLEVHKLAYFAQCAGADLNLQFAEASHGPYADKLRHVLNNIEGHYLKGVGDGRTKPTTPIWILPNAAREATKYLDEHSTMGNELFSRVVELINGFESSFGMELLASVHWVATVKDQRAKNDSVFAIEGVHAWNDRKTKLFSDAHIITAWKRLKGFGWL